MNLLRPAPLACCALLAACAGPSGRAGPGSAPATLDAQGSREVLVRFATMVEAGDFERAFPLLSSRWRARSSPARLARDHAGAGAAAREVVARARRAGPGAAVSFEGGRARLALGEGREAVLVAEGGVWRVDGLEAREKGGAVR